MTACLWAEARGETVEGQKAVCNVILNRVAKRVRPTLRAVIMQPNQFSWTNPTDVNFAKVLSAEVDEPSSWERANTIAKAGLNGTLIDITKNADHYLNVEATAAARGDGTLPAWFDPAKVTVVIGHHTFLNLLGPYE